MLDGVFAGDFLGDSKDLFFVVVFLFFVVGLVAV